MIKPLTTTCKNLSATLPHPSQPAHGRISKFELINLLTMRTLTIMPKFDIIKAKCTNVFTKTPHISTNQNLALATVVSSTFMTNQNYL